MNKRCGRDRPREIRECMKLKWMEEEDEGSQERNGIIILFKQ